MCPDHLLKLDFVAPDSNNIFFNTYLKVSILNSWYKIQEPITTKTFVPTYLSGAITAASKFFNDKLRK